MRRHGEVPETPPGRLAPGLTLGSAPASCTWRGASETATRRHLVALDDFAHAPDPYGELKIFAGSASGSLTRAICAQLKTEVARSETHVFSEGNVFVRVLENV